MDMDLNIDRSGDIPVYRQIIEQITIMVRNGEMKTGDKLPAERELACSLGVSRGTIKKAYEELERNNIIDVVQGSGSFVSEKQNVLRKHRKQYAIELIDEMITNLEALGFNSREISTLTQIRIRNRENSLAEVKIAGVDCNPEALSIFKNQLSYISNMEFSKFLLDDIYKYKDPSELFETFDIIITTSTHYGELQNVLPKLQDKIIQAAVSPSQQTVIDLAAMPANTTVGIICSSKQFLNIILSRLQAFDISPENVSYLLESAEANYASFIKTQDLLILPPEFEAEKNPDFLMEIEEYIKRDGKVVRFEYQMERGSLIYIEEQISKVIDTKK
jgi:Predicted transcriptional regulators